MKLSKKEAKDLLNRVWLPVSSNQATVLAADTKDARQAILRDPEHEDRETAAAIEIQRVYRGYMHRCHLYDALHGGISLETQGPQSSYKWSDLSVNSSQDSQNSGIPTIICRSPSSPIIPGQPPGIRMSSSRVKLKEDFCKFREQHPSISFEDFCALIIQSWWHHVCEQRRNSRAPSERPPTMADSYSTYNGRATQRPRTMTRLAAAKIIQKAWRKHVDMQVYRYYRDLISFKFRGDPALLLRCINPREAELLDSGSGTHVKFRLGGRAFPPHVYYKIFTHRNVVDMCANSSKDYYTKASTKQLVPRQYHNKEYINTEQENKDGWYQRYENNGWRLVSDRILRKIDEDAVTYDSAQKKMEFKHCKVFHHDIKWSGTVIRLRFRVKFYPEDLNDELIQLVTQRLFFLQAKEEILQDDVYCPTDKAVLLASLGCQAEFGEYNQLPISGRFLNKEKLLPDRIINQYKLSKGDWDRRITELWRRHGEMHSEDAIMAYLKIVQDLEMYGVKYFAIQNKKGSDLWLGIDTFGLHIYEKGNRLTPKVGFPWNEIKTLSFANKKFIIKPIEKKSPDFVFGVPVIDTNKRILALSMGNHELYMRRRRPDPVEILQMKAEAKHARKLKREERMTLVRERGERQKAEEINKQLEEKAKSLEMSARETAEALEREKNNNLELERQRLSAEEENARQKERSRQIEREKNMITRELSQKENENEYLRYKFSAVNMEMQRAVQEKQMKEKQLAEREEQMRQRRASEEHLQNNVQDVTNNNAHDDVPNSPVRGRHGLYEPDEVDGGSSAAHDLQVMPDARLPEYDRNSTMDTYIQSYLEVLGKDIYPELQERKLTTLDHIYAANIQAGRNKYRTLKRIRMGNTKQRVDQFECM